MRGHFHNKSQNWKEKYYKHIKPSESFFMWWLQWSTYNVKLWGSCSLIFLYYEWNIASIQFSLRILQYYHILVNDNIEQLQGQTALMLYFINITR